jgi:EamA domain-containing membrane protein RarD
MDTRARRTWWTVVAFAAWTLFVWTGRIRNVWADAALDTAGKVGRSALATSFVVLALPVLVWALRRRGGIPAAMRYLVVPLAAWTAGVWVVRSAGIWVHDHPVGFKVVHTVLAAISITLAALAVKRLRSDPEVHVEREREAAAPAPGLEELTHG